MRPAAAPMFATGLNRVAMESWPSFTLSLFECFSSTLVESVGSQVRLARHIDSSTVGIDLFIAPANVLSHAPSLVRSL